MGEIKIVGPGKTRGYPYLVCKKYHSLEFVLSFSLVPISLKLNHWITKYRNLTSRLTFLSLFFLI